MNGSVSPHAEDKTKDIRAATYGIDKFQRTKKSETQMKRETKAHRDSAHFNFKGNDIRGKGRKLFVKNWARWEMLERKGIAVILKFLEEHKIVCGKHKKGRLELSAFALFKVPPPIRYTTQECACVQLLDHREFVVYFHLSSLSCGQTTWRHTSILWFFLWICFKIFFFSLFVSVFFFYLLFNTPSECTSIFPWKGSFCWF